MLVTLTGNTTDLALATSLFLRALEVGLPIDHRRQTVLILIVRVRQDSLDVPVAVFDGSLGGMNRRLGISDAEIVLPDLRKQVLHGTLHRRQVGSHVHEDMMPSNNSSCSTRPPRAAEGPHSTSLAAPARAAGSCHTTDDAHQPRRCVTHERRRRP